MYKSLKFKIRRKWHGSQFYIHVAVLCFVVYHVFELIHAYLLYLSSCLQATSENVIVGSKVWVEDPELAWIDGEVTKINGQELHVQTTHGKSVSITSLYFFI